MLFVPMDRCALMEAALSVQTRRQLQVIAFLLHCPSCVVTAEDAVRTVSVTQSSSLLPYSSVTYRPRPTIRLDKTQVHYAS